MLYIVNDNLNPHFNLALEEYLLRGLKKPAFMLWRNSKSVIIGCNQNASMEVNEKYAIENNITVARRLTGGGAVFHDEGNINYTIISNDTNAVGDYEAFTSDLRDFLSDFGIVSTLSGRNDILVNNRKICGNAQGIKNNMIIHHGCILYSTDIKSLSNVLQVNELKYQYKGIKSVKSRVSNLIDLIDNKPSSSEFMNMFKNYLIKKHHLEEYHLTNEDITEINKLVIEKYGTYEWIFGASPKYNFKNTAKTNAGVIEIYLDVSNGIIEKAKIYGDFFSISPIIDLENSLLGLKHNRNELLKLNLNIEKYISNLTDNEFIDILTNKE